MTVADTSALFSPYSVRGITLRNRFILPGMQRGWGKHYAPTPKLMSYYRRCIEGGVSLIITEATIVDHPSATGHDAFKLMVNADTADAWRRCLEEVRDAGGRILIQLSHEGATRRENVGGPDPSYPTLSASGLVAAGKGNGRAATRAELWEIRDAYVRTARLAKELGADGVEVHAAHGYFLDQFLWSVTNLRTDEYGGATLAERSRYPAEIVAAIREAVGEDFIISLRFSHFKEVDYTARICESPSELGEMLIVFRRAGVDLFHASTRRFYAPEWPGSELNLAGWAKSMTDAGVITVGSVGLTLDAMDTAFTDKPVHLDLEAGLERLSSRFSAGEFDLVAVGRSMLNDQQWVNKIRDGKLSEIRPFNRAVIKESLEDWDGAVIMDARQNNPGLVTDD